jgi:amidase
MDLGTANLHYLQLAELAALIKARKVSPLEATRAQLDRIAALDGALGSYALVMADAAVAQAAAAEKEIAAGTYRGPLHGVPVAVKDLCWTTGVPTAGGMTIYRDFRPDQDATVVRRLSEAGAVILGKLQLTEGAYADHHPAVAPPRNPWNADYWTGASSSGSGAATAAGLCYGSLGSDTGGSIRFPSAANGLTGLKPSWGRVSRHGVFELAATLDHIGPMTRSAVDAGIMLGAIAGSDPNDPTARLDPVPDYLADVGQGVRGMRIGVDAAWNSEGVDDATRAMVAAAIEVFRGLGAVIEPITFPDVRQTIKDWIPACGVETAVAHEATYPARKSEYGPALAGLIDTGRQLSGLDYQKILLRRHDVRGRVATVLRSIDLLLIPAIPFSPPTLAMMRTLGEQPELLTGLLQFTCPFDMTGDPTITLPGGFTEGGLPMAFQLVAADMNEAKLVRAGAAFQGVTSWHRRHPIT